MKFKIIAFVLILFGYGQHAFSHFKTTPDSPIHITADGKLVYKADANGDRVPDFSYCGYMSSEMPIPDVAVKVIVPTMEGNATEYIQNAINYVSSLPLDKNGFRGTILLEKGTFKVAGGLIIQASGVVLRGTGCNNDGTILIGTGVDRETLIRITGVNNRKIEARVQLADKYFPVNSTILTFKNGHSFKVGDQVIVNRPSTKEWLEKIGTDKIGIYVDYTLTKWDAGDFDQNWDRRVIAITPESITIDVPITNSLDPQFGGGNVAKYTWNGRISNVGIENIKCISSFDSSNVKDENHRWMAITMDNVTDSWVRRVVAEHFVSSAVAVWGTARRITVEDCKSLAPVGEIGNYRRYSFHTLGQQVLFQRCYAEYGYHAFSVGFTASGPNAFVQCYSYLPYNFSGAIGGWATGVLFDKMTVDGGIISLAYRDVDGQGGGWSAANSLCWQCRAAQIHLPAPPTAQNWAYASWAQGYGNGHHELQHTFVKPESIYYAESSETTAPSIELSAIMSERSKTPDLIMDEWIDQMIDRFPIISNISGAKKLSDTGYSISSKEAQKSPSFSIKNGWIVKGNQVITGKKNRTSMWRGTTRPGELVKPAPNLVRFVPGRIGRGLTDDLDTLANDMIRNNVVVMQNFPALWYERRRDDHARTRRANADVWAPFYEQPFSRSGQGEAFDRLSKYDLTKWNTWYWLRLKKFADLADQKGLLFLQEHYLQHNIIEEGAHWADYPWRTANNINNTGFAENPHFAGDKRVYMGVEFYDTTNTVRNQFHRAYIRKSLDNFKDNINIIHHLGMEYTGPLHFVKFWLDVIGEWEKENNRHVLVMLPGTKDVQDSILADPKRSALVDIIDVIQWQYRKDSSLYAPVGGVSLAPRQYERIIEVGETSFDQIYHAVNEYHTKYPEKAIVYSRPGTKFSDWAVFMAGGSFASLPKIENYSFFENATEMSVVSMKNPPTNEYVLGRKGTGYIIFSESGNIKIDLSNDKYNYSLKWINPSTGAIVATQNRLSGGVATSINAPSEGAVVLWLSKE
ncbi:MAG: DUF6298 domain-containing protein [Bacteroidia bacterium]|nr:DUF6298 domain-containing protein [Bacteroidia bacterium]